MRSPSLSPIICLGCVQQGLQEESTASLGPEEEVAESKVVAKSEDPTAAGLSVTVTHSNEKHDLRVTPQQGCSEPTVEDVAQVVEEATGVLLPFQKLTRKGKISVGDGEAIVCTRNTKWLWGRGNWENKQSREEVERFGISLWTG